MPSIPLQRAFELRYLISPRSIYSGTTLGIPGIHEGPTNCQGGIIESFLIKMDGVRDAFIGRLHQLEYQMEILTENMQLNMCFISSYTPNLHHERLGNPV